MEATLHPVVEEGGVVHWFELWGVGSGYEDIPGPDNTAENWGKYFTREDRELILRDKRKVWNVKLSISLDMEGDHG